MKTNIWTGRHRRYVGPTTAEHLSIVETRTLWAMAHLHTHYGRCTVRDVASLVGTEVSTVHQGFLRLEAKGYAERYSPIPLWRPLVTLVQEG